MSAPLLVNHIMDSCMCFYCVGYILHEKQDRSKRVIFQMFAFLLIVTSDHRSIYKHMVTIVSVTMSIVASIFLKWLKRWLYVCHLFLRAKHQWLGYLKSIAYIEKSSENIWEILKFGSLHRPWNIERIRQCKSPKSMMKNN